MNKVEYVDFGFDSDQTDYPLERDKNRASLIGAFEMAFSNSPYQENFDFDLMKNFLEETKSRDYEGKIAISEGSVVGFAWGYRVEPRMCSDFPEELQDSEIEFYDGETFYFEELGVVPDYRDQGLGKELKKRELKDVESRDDISRGLMRTQYNGENLRGLEVPEDFLDKEADENSKKLGIDVNLGFEPLDIEGKPVIEEVELVGTEGGDERIYMWRQL